MDRYIKHHQRGRGRKTINTCVLNLILLSGCYDAAFAAPSLLIPQVPLIMSTPVHPQVLIAIGNSQSMDGVLSGAIMTGSGSVAAALNSLNNSSSPLNYLVPSGFTPPVQAASGGYAPYTVNVSGTLYDNGPSRLNVAKAGVTAILQSFMQTTDFALATYKTSGTSTYTTWVYYMSPQGSNFAFTNTPISTNRYVTNPCYNYSTASSTIKSNCTSIATSFGSATLSGNQYMQIGASSDDPNINDVLYAGSSIPGVFLTYSGPTPTTPYPPNYSISNYNSGSVLSTYKSSLPSIGSFGTSPTNAGYVPYSPQVMYAERGFGFYGSQTANAGNILVPMTTAGTYPSASTITTAINKFLPYLKPETNSSTSTEIKSVATQSPIAGLLTQANTYLKPLATTSGNGCPQQKYVILISDGLPTQDLSGKLWPPLGSAAAAGYGITATFNTDGSLQTTNCQALTDAISAITTLKNNGIQTFVIGLGAGVDPSINPQAAATLTAMAVAGGTTNYYPATDSVTLVNDLYNIMVSIQDGTYSTSAAAVSSTRLSGATVEYEANFVSSDTPYKDWTGNLFELSLNPTTGLPTNTILWSAQPLLDSLVSGSGWSTNRKIATWNPTTSTGVPFQWTSISTAEQALLQPSDTLGQSRLQYLRGSSALEVRNGGTFRNRSHVLGDIVDSQVTFLGAPQAAYNSSSYLSFMSNYQNRTPLIFVGANDGIFHAFNASTGNEVFGYIPYTVFSDLYNLTAPNYNYSHLFYLNGSPQTGDAQFSDGTWHTLVVSGENAGGNSIFALDVTNAGALANETALANSVLWEFTDADMGLSFSAPQIAPIGQSNATNMSFAVFFGNGYNSPNNNAVLYAVDPKTGTIISKINLCTAVPAGCNSLLPQGLSSVAVANLDGLQAEPITNVYAGDLQGNLWSINVSNLDPTQWSVRLLFQATDAGGNPQAITTTPVVTLNPNYPRTQGLFVMFGTGQLLTENDMSTTQTQTIYGVLDKPATSTTYTRANLQKQTLTLVSQATSGLSTSVITATASTVNWNNVAGWYDDLPIAGQRIVTNPTVINGSFIATLNTPPTQMCGSGFTSMLLELNYLNGGAFTTPQFDLNGDGKINKNDIYNNTYPVGISLQNSYANAPTVLGPNSNNNLILLITQANGTQSSIITPNNVPRKIGWWQF